MKRIVLFLVFILCIVPVLGACGVNSSPEKAAEAAFKAEIVDCDYEAYYEVAYAYNLDLLDEYMEGSDKLEALKDACRASREVIKEDIRNTKNSYEELKDYDIRYDIRYCMIYEKDSDAYISMMKSFGYAGTAIADEVKEVAVVGIVADMYSTLKEGGDETVYGDYMTYYCFNIGGDWYVGNLGIGNIIDDLDIDPDDLGGLLG